MSGLDDSDAWRQVPPEVKLEIMSRSHSRGFMTAVAFVVIASTCAVALQFVWLMWGSLLLAPIIFQISANKAWRALRPATLLRHLAAKSAARRFAYAAKSQDLTLDLIFQGTLKRRVDEKDVTGALEAAIANNNEVEVWVTLFKDTVVMMSERLGGAKVELAQKINEQLTLESISPNGEDYTVGKELFLTVRTPNLTELGGGEVVSRYQLTSRYPAALIVFEKELQKRLKDVQYPAPAVEQNTGFVGAASETKASTDEEDDLFARQF